MNSVIIYLSTLSISVSLFAFAKTNTMVSSTPTFPIECSAYVNNGKSTKFILSNLDGIFVDGGSKNVGVLLDGKMTPGFIFLANGHDNNFHGTKYIDIRFGNQLSITATLSPSRGFEKNRAVIGEGPGTYLQFGHTTLGNAYCRIYSNCEKDSRVCPN